MVDPKVRNLALFVFPRVGVLAAAGYGLHWLLRSNVAFLAGNAYLNMATLVLLILVIWRTGLSLIRRLLLPARDPLSYGKWAIVTGSTSGIGEEFASHLSSLGMSLLLISRSESKLAAQAADLKTRHPGMAECRYLVYDFTNKDSAVRDAFYNKALSQECLHMSGSGGLGILVNNVGIANEIPKSLDEFDDAECDDLITCNIQSTVFMTKVALKVMKKQQKGAIICVSSGSGNHPGPFISIYSATKAFMTQFCRSMHVECWDSGIDFLVVTPFYIVSNLYKRKTGTFLAPMPDVLVRGTLAQLGKKYVWQGHGYWLHGLLGNLASYYWETTRRWRKMMVDNRKRYDERQKQS